MASSPLRETVAGSVSTTQRKAHGRCSAFYGSKGHGTGPTAHLQSPKLFSSTAERLSGKQMVMGSNPMKVTKKRKSVGIRNENAIIPQGKPNVERPSPQGRAVRLKK